VTVQGHMRHIANHLWMASSYVSIQHPTACTATIIRTQLLVTHCTRISIQLHVMC